MKRVLDLLFGNRQRPLEQSGAPRLSSARFPRAIYAIGDVHGCLDLLIGLEDKIAAHAGMVDEDIWVVLLGDLIDRGPKSAQVVEYLLKPHPAGFRRLCLGGNHEQAMLEALENPDSFGWWRQHGGEETLASYGLNMTRLDAANHAWSTMQSFVSAYIPKTHRDFLSGLPVMLSVPGFIFAHAGLKPGLPPEKHTDHDLRWFNGPVTGDRQALGATIVHGHTITPRVGISEHVIAIDTGAYDSGRLSSVCLAPDAEPMVLEHCQSAKAVWRP